LFTRISSFPYADGGGDQMVPRRFRDHIRFYKRCSVLAGTNVGGDGVAFLLEHVGDNDRSTLLGEQPGFRRTRAVCTTGNDCDLVFQSHASLPCR
jgi:hypothetical protein